MYNPEQGDIVYINFDPSIGHEIKKRRPGLVVSKTIFNKLTGFCLICPITSTQRSFGTYVTIEQPARVNGEVVTHQLRSMDFEKRKLEFVEQCDPVTWANVISTIDQFIE
ncbi:type II toxin-antitoxin system PemK/MazF family toxin [Lactiplantibacillus herbarum]|uniref:type II toxin-antitoxin system PemK/MazF family toxin n=1 Tax=Lactiplantibacillus herbarum TaxID=1670446 RepID=UPI00064F76E9|nr:type II toxin-antitoxin system PemK/MazF family toxin [Lactiplantibacillus herbarum]